MASPTSSASDPAPSRRWSVLAGVYAFGCGAVTALVLSAVLRVFAQVIGLPESLPVPLLAAPALLVGGVVWWALVERRATYTYPAGMWYGALTALLTGFVWTTWFLVVWSVDLLIAGPTLLLVALVFALTTLAGTLIGPPMIFVRRRYAGG
jgi:high-affinity Fe2+/Pb2+ permease